jgi:hypothetical protein
MDKTCNLVDDRSESQIQMENNQLGLRQLDDWEAEALKRKTYHLVYPKEYSNHLYLTEMMTRIETILPKWKESVAIKEEDTRTGQIFIHIFIQIAQACETACLKGKNRVEIEIRNEQILKRAYYALRDMISHSPSREKHQLKVEYEWLPTTQCGKLVIKIK